METKKELYEMLKALEHQLRESNQKERELKCLIEEKSQTYKDLIKTSVKEILQNI